MGERMLNPESSSGRIAEAISGVSSATLDLRVSQHNSDQGQAARRREVARGERYADQHGGDGKEGEGLARAHTAKKIPMKRQDQSARNRRSDAGHSGAQGLASTSLIISGVCAPTATRMPT